MSQWWVVSGEDMLDMLRRVERGEKPEMVYTEMYANSSIEKVEGSDGD